MARTKLKKRQGMLENRKLPKININQIKKKCTYICFHYYGIIWFA